MERIEYDEERKREENLKKLNTISLYKYNSIELIYIDIFHYPKNFLETNNNGP